MEQNFDEILDVNPFLAEIYSNNSSSSSSSGLDQLRISTSTNSWNGQETIGVATDHDHPLLISFDRFSSSSYCPQIISFDHDLGKRERASPATRTPLQAQDHVMAERKRRDHLRQLFIALSKVVPGLKKLDKASLLEDAINYLKLLQERVIALEKEAETSTSTSTVQDNGLIGRAEVISVRISERNVLIKIIMCCKKLQMSRIPCEMERMHLSVIDIRVMPFGGAAIHLTILAQVQSGFVGSVKDIVNHLQAVVGQV